MRGFIRFCSSIITLATSVVLAVTILYNDSLPDDVQIYKGESLNFNTAFDVSAQKNDGYDAVSENNVKAAKESYSVSLKLFGVIPIKNVNVSEVDELYVAVSGDSFGIKIFTEGVMVVGMTQVDSPKGSVNPAAACGIKIGDVILTINGEKVASNDDVAGIIENSGGKAVKVVVMRDGKRHNYELCAVKSVSEDKYKAGIWVRDSSAGIGTMTFYSPINGAFAGLGHAISDIDTGMILPLESGEIVGTHINSVNRSEKGKTGEICGSFTFKRLGTLTENCSKGLYGTLDKYDSTAKLTKIAMKNEVKTGRASIITTLDDSGPKSYDCVIEKINYNDSGEQNMVIRVTDKELISKTGGIVQGMSGSPIIQNNCLIGAVTHVFINEPERGYAIFSESMYQQMLSNLNEYSAAS